MFSLRTIKLAQPEACLGASIWAILGDGLCGLASWGKSNCAANKPKTL